VDGDNWFRFFALWIPSRVNMVDCGVNIAEEKYHDCQVKLMGVVILYLREQQGRVQVHASRLGPAASGGQLNATGMYTQLEGHGRVG